ncbi:MAG: hypothetical protein M3R40_05785, partial [Pseudomonadota bacterium]|nr:hypothetical protein [Pseudomonadota bacterium]
MSQVKRGDRSARFRRFTVAGAVGLMVAVVLSTFAALPAGAQSSAPIKIGVLLPKSGPYAIQGENGYNGAQIAVADFGGKVL